MCPQITIMLKHCDNLIDTWFSDLYSNANPIINVTEQNPNNISIVCYHPTFSRIAWYLNISSLQETVEYFMEDSELAHSEYGISIQSTCPDDKCHSTLSMPNDVTLNNTVIWCEGYTEVCPDIKTTSHPITVIIERKDPSIAGKYMEY